MFTTSLLIGKFEQIHFFVQCDLRDTSAMFYQLSYEASLVAGQERVQFIPFIWREWNDVHMINADEE